MFQLPCPNCGPRNASEFRFGGEVTVRPSGDDQREWANYIYNRRNTAGVQEEWWYHRSGCQRWFKARRNTLTNEILDIF